MQENERPLDEMAYLVYWYRNEKRQDFYSLVLQSSFVPGTDKIIEHSKNPGKTEKKAYHGNKTEHLGDDWTLEDVFNDRVREDVGFLINNLEELSATSECNSVDDE